MINRRDKQMINLDKILVECFECGGTGKGEHFLDDPSIDREFTEPLGFDLCVRCGGSGQISNGEA